MKASKIGDSSIWSVTDSEEYYGLKRWGDGHFSIDEDGNMLVHPLLDQRSIRIVDIVKKAARKGLKPPLTVRIKDLLSTRVILLNKLFYEAIKDEKYDGSYRGVFPIKVNQLREVVEEILDAGKSFNYGIECGSKPELAVAIAMHKNSKSLIVCNGYKDDEFIRLALQGSRLGKEIYLVVEQISELPRIIKMSKKIGIIPRIGLRLKLDIAGQGKWASSSSDNAKFGLTSPEVVYAVDLLKRAGLGDSLRLLHFHIGSQVPNIHIIKKATIEASRYYCELKKMGFPLELLDVGGGLGIDYDGSGSNRESSTNYNMRDYARDMVYNINNICRQSGVEVPDIISESGRSVVAFHSIIITEVCDRMSKTAVRVKTQVRGKKINPLLNDMHAIFDNEHKSTVLERYYEALQKKEEANSLFSLGYLKLHERAQIDTAYWTICNNLRKQCENDVKTSEELNLLSEIMADQYICNFSIFQSLIDHWACKQLFPIVPLHRLNEYPHIDTSLVDITCDSEGKVSSFTDVEDTRNTLRLHSLNTNEPYYLGIFLVGAYQDILGNYHNLFGRVNQVHVCMKDDQKDSFYIEQGIEGNTVSDVLSFTQYDISILIQRMKKIIDRSTEDGEINICEGKRILDEYIEMLSGHTYLTT